MDETRHTTDEVVYLLAELPSAGHGPVHEIGSRARVIAAEGDELTLAVDCGDGEEVVRCPRSLVARAQRSLRARRRPLRSAAPAFA